MVSKSKINKVLNMRSTDPDEISQTVEKEFKIEGDYTHDSEEHDFLYYWNYYRKNFPLVSAVHQGSLDCANLRVCVYNRKYLNTSNVVLIGKGVVYDSGGYSLKSSKGMVDMHFDKSGAILVAAYCAQNKKIPGIAFYVSNMISGDALVPGTIIKSSEGTDVLITDTDAEGRLGLADCLEYVKKVNPTAMCVSVATLTGAAVAATGEQTRSLIHTTDIDLQVDLITNQRYHKMWPMFSHKDYDNSIKTKVKGADICNYNFNFRGGGSQTAYSFLKHFNRNLVHIDMAGFMTDKDGNNASYEVLDDIDYIVKYIKKINK